MDDNDDAPAARPPSGFSEGAVVHVLVPKFLRPAGVRPGAHLAQLDILADLRNWVAIRHSFTICWLWAVVVKLGKSPGEIGKPSPP